MLGFQFPLVNGRYPSGFDSDDDAKPLRPRVNGRTSCTEGFYSLLRTPSEKLP